jgi:hypothetical protein
MTIRGEADMRAGAYKAAVAEQRRPGRVISDGSIDLYELVRMGTLAALSHNTQPWLFRLQNRSIEVVPDFSRRCPVVDPDDAHLFKSLGCAAENIVQAAAAQGHAAEAAFDPTRRSIKIALHHTLHLQAGPLFHRSRSANRRGGLTMAVPFRLRR